MSSNINHSLPTVIFLIDCSGSMENHVTVMTSKLQPIWDKFGGDIQANLGIATFCNDYNGLSIGKPTKNPIYYGGGTALNHSAIELLRELSAVHKLSSRNKVLTILITDGRDAARSHKESVEEVANEISIAEDINRWDFLYIGTDTQAYEIGNRMGVKPGKAFFFQGTKEGFSAMLSNVDSIVDKWVKGNLAHESEFFTQDMKTEQDQIGQAARIRL